MSNPFTKASWPYHHIGEHYTMASQPDDTLIKDTDRAPMDNRPNTAHKPPTDPGLSDQTTTKTEPLTTKKKRHSKKVMGSKEKRARVDPALITGENLNDNNPDTIPSGLPLIPPDFLNAIRMSLKDNLLQTCQQACQQALNNRDTLSSASSIPTSPNRTQAPDKRRNHSGKHSHPPLTKTTKGMGRLKRKTTRTMMETANHFQAPRTTIRTWNWTIISLDSSAQRIISNFLQNAYQL